MEIKIDGLKELSEMLTQESVRTAKRYLLNIAKPAAQVVVDAMKETAPELSQRLEKEIAYQSRYSGGDETTLTVSIGPAPGEFYGMFQEFGAQGGKQGGHTPALHWMARAFEASKDECLSVFGTEALARLADMEEKK